MNSNKKKTEAAEWEMKTSSTSVKRYGFEWKEISQYLLTNNLHELKNSAVKGNLKTSKFRSVCWALFFNLLDNEESAKWGTQRIQQRERYVKLKQQFYISPQSMKNANDDNPLSQSDKSIWNQHFCDQELCAVIKQDVVRTFPGIEFFRKAEIQEIMVSILFCYARENPEMCYRQGMHEILAPVLFVIHSDHQSYRHYRELNDDVECEVMRQLLDHEHLEEDAFLLFAFIMSEIEHFYRINDMRPTSTGYFPVSPFPSTEHSPEVDAGQSTATTSSNDSRSQLKPDVEIVGQLNIIREQILSKADPALYNHLLQLDIPLSLFGIRWLRLLFGREFPLQDLLILWDAIFAVDEKFVLTNYVVVSMLITIRDRIVSHDYTTCLTHLMKYPNTIDISHIIKLALHIKSPQQYENPLNGHRGEVATLPRVSKTPHSHIETSTNRRPSTSVNRNIQTSPAIVQPSQETLARVNGIHKQTARAAVKTAAQAHSIGEPDLGIVDGYRENDPEVSILTLQHAQSIMSISRYKLIGYLATIRRNLPDNTHENVRQSLDGIEEICSLLKNCYSTYSSSMPISCPVEPAFEAGEAAAAAISLHKPLGNLLLDLNTSQQQQNRPASSKTRKRVDSTSLAADFYEIPENSRIATQMFGNVRDIPMRVFKSATAPDTNRLQSNEQILKEMPTPDPTNDHKELVDDYSMSFVIFPPSHAANSSND